MEQIKFYAIEIYLLNNNYLFKIIGFNSIAVTIIVVNTWEF